MPLIGVDLDLRSLVIIGTFSAVIVFELWTRRDRVSRWWIAAALAVLIVAYGTRIAFDYAQVGVVWWIIAVALLALALLIVLIAASSGRGDRRRSSLLVVCFLEPLILLVAAQWLTSPEVVSTDPDSIETIVTWGLAAAALFPLVIGDQWYRFLQEEDAHLVPGRQAEERVWAGYLVLLAFLFCSAIAGFGVVEVVHPIVDLSVAEAAPIPNAPHLAVGVVVGVFLALVAVALARPTPLASGDTYPPIDVRLEVRWPVTIVLVLATASWGLTPWAISYLSSGPTLPTALASVEPLLIGRGVVLAGILVAAWVGFLTRESLHANIGANEFYQLDRKTYVVSFASGVAAVSTVGWLLVVGMWGPLAPAQPASVALATGLVYLGNMLVLTGVGWALSRVWPIVRATPPYISRHHATSHIFNDHLMLGMLITITVTVSYVGYLTTEALGGSLRVIVMLIQLWALLSIAPVFERIMAVGMKKHIDDERNRKPAQALEIRAGGTEEKIKELDAKRILQIEERFERDRKVSITLSVFFLVLVARVVFAWLTRFI